jgi:uncharacterized protein
MESSDIKIDKEGIWYFRGAHMFRKDILSIFFEHLRIDEHGKYLIDLNKEKYYLDVEDTAFVVTVVDKRQDSETTENVFYVQLTDDSCEKLDLDTLYVGNENVLYCTVKNRQFPARFSRSSYYHLAQFIEHEENSFFIRLNDEKYYINNYEL